MKGHPHWGYFHITWPLARRWFEMGSGFAGLIVVIFALTRIAALPVYLVAAMFPFGVGCLGSFIIGLCYLFNEGDLARWTRWVVLAAFVASIAYSAFRLWPI